MKNLIITLTIVIIILGSLSVALLAQEGSPLPEPTSTPVVEPPPEPGPGELPETAVGALALLIAGLGALGGIVTEWGTELIKRLPLIKPADKDKISGNWAKFVAGLVALVTTGVQAYGILGAEWLDENGIWALVLLAFNWAGADLLHRAMRKTKRSPATV
jgi:hypothetical protein